jgi:BirA family biotin operon repressor/biotin-[acetyl-CoA-carboxylase] ligase
MITQFIVHHYGRISSTNDEAHRLAASGAPHGTVIQADEQITGRGRLFRMWLSPPGNLYMSVILRIGLSPARTAEISFLAALAVADTVRTLLPQQNRVHLKWPNDVLVNEAKISGILLENANDAIVLGIGLNILWAPQDISYGATAIVANGGVASADDARDVLLDRLADYLALWQSEGFDPIHRAWLDRTCPIGATIHVNMGRKVINGKFAGLGTDGALFIETEGGVRRVIAGDVRQSACKPRTSFDD